MERIAAGVWLQGAVAEGFPTVAAVVVTRTRAVVIDTLVSPEAMAPVREFLAREAGAQRISVVNTHHHWDHVYGNAAFPGVEIIAHEDCPGCMREQAAGRGEPAPPPPLGGVPLPTITFSDRLILLDDDRQLTFIHAPGHSADELVVLAEPGGLLFAGDALEWPLPSLGPGSNLTVWLATLAVLRDLGARLVIPSHGPVMGPELIAANARYLAGLGAAAAALPHGSAGAPDVPPVGDLVAPGVAVDELHRAVHAANLAWLRDAAAPGA